jgi:hypothetical protein
MTPQGSDPVGHGRIIALSLIALIAVAFSDDLVETIFGQPNPWLVVVADVLLLLFAFRLIWAGQIATRRISARTAGIWYAIGAALTLGIDLYIAIAHPATLYRSFWAAALYYVAFLLLTLPALAVNPVQLVEKNSAEARERLALGMPLLVGTLGAYVASYSWQWNGGVINQEYFAQMSQVIPLVFLAVGIEGEYFRRKHGKTSMPGLTGILLGLLVLGEVMALSALVPKTDGGLAGWHGYFGLVLTAFACIAALTALIPTMSGMGDSDRSSVSGPIGTSAAGDVSGKNDHNQLVIAALPTETEPTPPESTEQVRANLDDHAVETGRSDREEVNP